MKDGIFGGFSLNSVIRDLFGRDVLGARYGEGAEAPSPWRPTYNVDITEAGVVLDVDMPSVLPRDVTAWVTRDQVIVKGSRAGTSFTHTYTLSADYDTCTAEASMAGDRLRVRVSRHPPVAPRRIPVEHATR